MQLIGFSLIKLTGSAVLRAGGEPRCRSSAGSCSGRGRPGEGPAWGGRCGVRLQTCPAASVTGVSPNECPGRSEGQERGQPQWPHGDDTVPEGTPGTVCGLGAGDGLGAVGTVVPVLGLSPVTLRARPPVKAAPRSNGNFYEKVKSSGFPPLKRYFSPGSRHPRGICSPTAAFSMRHPLVSCLSREGSRAIPAAARCTRAGRDEPRWHRGTPWGRARGVVPIGVLPPRQRPGGEKLA